MPDITFAIILYSSMTAIFAAYAFLMSNLQRKLNQQWIKGELYLMALAIIVSQSVFAIFADTNLFQMFSFGILALASLNLAVLFVIVRKDIANDTTRTASKVFGSTLFALLVIHFLLFLAV